MTPSTNARWAAVCATGGAAAILLLNARLYFPFLSDDALISLRYSRRLLDGFGLTWTEGHRVEGYSNLLWVLLVAVPGAFGIDLILAARGLGLLAMTTMLGALAYWYSTRYPLAIAWFPAVVGLLFLSLSAPIAVWSIGGLEQPLVAVLLTVAICLLFAVLDTAQPGPRTIEWLSVTLGLLCVTRPDGPLFAAAMSGSVLVLRRSARLALRLLVFPVALSGAQLAFRLVYYGELVPNTALVKIAPTTARWVFGWEYVQGGMSALAPFSYLAIVALVLLLPFARWRSRALPLLALTLSWGGYLVFIGGDIFPAYRHFVPLVVVFAFALAEGARAMATQLPNRRGSLPLAALVALALFVPFAERQANDPHSIRAVRERWEWQGKEVALLLKRAFHRQQPLQAVTAAGSIPYWSELPSLDMLGLNDYYLPRHPPAGFGNGFLGHELGDAQYVLGRNPDLIVFTVGSPPEFRAGQQLAAAPEFTERYVPVPVKTQPVEYQAIVYFNKYSDKPGMGIAISDSTVAIPGFLFTGAGAVAQLNARDRLVATMTSDQALQVVFTSGDTLAGSALDVRASHPSAIVGEVQQDQRRITVTLRSTTGIPVEIEEVILRKP